jgi:hypothetical protein
MRGGVSAGLLQQQQGDEAGPSSGRRPSGQPAAARSSGAARRFADVEVDTAAAPSGHQQMPRRSPRVRQRPAATTTAVNA